MKLCAVFRVYMNIYSLFVLTLSVVKGVQISTLSHFPLWSNFDEVHVDDILRKSVCTSQETHQISTTKPNRLMLFGETVAVYCENHTEHTNTLCGQNAEF
jgi:hypothetical protein